MNPRFLVLLLLLACLAHGTLSETNYGVPQDAILKSSISSLTFNAGEWTTARRPGLSPIPRLQCTGGTTHCDARSLPTTVRCANAGQGDDGSVQWTCTTDTLDIYRFGKMQVSCEGYNSPRDPYVLRGSCGLRYEWDFLPGKEPRPTAQGFQQNALPSLRIHSYFSSSHSQTPATSPDDGYIRSVLAVAIVFTVIILMLKCLKRTEFVDVYRADPRQTVPVYRPVHTIPVRDARDYTDGVVTGVHLANSLNDRPRFGFTAQRFDTRPVVPPQTTWVTEVTQPAPAPATRIATGHATSDDR